MNPIGWATDTWSPVTGCSPVSPACDHCYAERMATRLAGRFGYAAEDPFQVTFHPDRLDQPLKWKKPRRVFVCSMGDLFHEDVESEWIHAVFTTMAAAHWHTFLVLTKRPEIMGEWFATAQALGLTLRSGYGVTLPNVWLGVTVESQWAANTRIPDLLDTPAAHRFVSCEPLLGPVNLRHIPGPLEPRLRSGKVDLVIAGAETGPGARPAEPDWFRSLRDQCQGHIPFYLKDRPGTIDGVQYREIPGGMAL